MPSNRSPGRAGILASGLALAMCGLYASRAEAQQLEHFSLDRYEPTPAGDRFFGVPGGDDGAHGAVRGMLLGEYAWRPLVLYRNDGDNRVGSIVRDQVFLHLGVGFGLWHRLNVSANLPFALVSSGTSPTSSGISVPSPDGAALGDMRLSARLRLVGAPRSAAELDIGGSLWLPTGDQDKFTGDGAVRGRPELTLSGETSVIAYALNAGVVLRPQRNFLATEVGSEFAFGGALGFLLAERKLQIGPEIYGTSTFNRAFERDTTNAEVLLGGRLRVGPAVLGAAWGPGLTRGLGTPASRTILSLTLAPEPNAEKVRGDRDHDKIWDDIDACPDTPGIKSDDPERNGCPDRDEDGIFDKDDACPDVAGVASTDKKKNGCPSDRDGDGIIDSEDACPDVPGEENEDPKKNGCQPDRDGDGIIDKDDACPDIRGVVSEDPEKNGCPGDRDGDGIRDDKDACPDEKGKPDPDPKKNGCPSLVRVTKTEIAILQQVEFKTASDVILQRSDELLAQVSEVLREHPEIKSIEVQGHTDNRGAAAYNQKLSERRAKSVMRWLVERGSIDSSRLEAKGYGMDQPIDENSTEEGRQRNRRVQFKIIKMDKKAEPTE
ncbi:MAG: OmpA family protein [Polyangiaceae bacterium]